ncbi:MAG: hypothetical protein NTW72_11360 [Gemmatimonadetes bacterium]|nr:hypothetical protein [Gemmatimonadota bacterium]
MTASNGLFALIIVAALGFFASNVQRLVGFLRIGRLDDSRWDAIPRRLANLITIGVFQKKIFRDSIAGPMHAAIFWGFCILSAGTVEFLAAGVVPGFSFARFMPQWAYRFYMGNQDLWGALVLGALALALFRRLTKSVKRLQGAETHPNDPLFILSWIGLLMITMFLTEAFHMVGHPEAATPFYRPISFALAQMVAFVPVGAANVIHGINWWAHGLLVLGFLNYLPYSKHLHVVASLPNVYLSNTSGPGQPGVMKYMDLEGDAEWTSKAMRSSSAPRTWSTSRGRACSTASRAPSAAAAPRCARPIPPARCCRRARS